jgi:hypothetical protein
MPWTKAKQETAEQDTLAFAAEYVGAFNAVKEKISTGASDPEVLAAYTAVSEVLRRWRAQSDALQSEVSNSAQLDQMQVKLAELTGQREILARLESEAGTRGNQAASVNPKVTASPYTNILGLQRTFRSATRSGLMVAGIVFAVLAVAALVFLAVRLLMAGGVPSAYTSMSGGGGGSISTKVSRGGT